MVAGGPEQSTVFLNRYVAESNITIINVKYNLQIMMACAPDDFEEVKPVFDHILKTINLRSRRVRVGQ